MTLTIRPAVEADLPAMARVGAQAFPGVDAKVRERHIREHPLATLDDMLVAEERGQLAGTATVIPMIAWWAGQPWPAGGLASVAVAPEARRCGVASRLCDAVIARLREREVPLCLLYPFDARFYAARGWHLAGLSRRLTIRASWLPRVDGPPLEWIDAGKGTEALAASHGRWLRQRGVGLERPANAWRRLMSQSWQWFGLPGDGELEGHLAVANHRDPATRQLTLQVAEMPARSPEARRRLLGFLRDQEAQCEWIEMTVPAETPLEGLTVNPVASGASDLGNGHFLCSQLVAGAMVRVLDWPRLLAALPARADMPLPPLALDIAGTGRWQLHPGGELTPSRGAGAEATLTLDEGALTQILWGVMTPSQALAWGRAHLDAACRLDLRALDAALAQPSLFIPRLDDF